MNRNRRYTVTSFWSLWALLLVCLVSLSGCRSSRSASKGIDDQSEYLSSKVELTMPVKDALFSVDGTLKLHRGERIQLSFLMPILRSEVARMEVTPDEVLLVDRMGKRYVRASREELKVHLPRKYTYDRLEKLLFQAAKPNGKRSLKGSDLGLMKLEKAQITLLDFATSPLKMQPTTLSSRYRQVPLEELVGMLLNLAE